MHARFVRTDFLRAQIATPIQRERLQVEVTALRYRRADVEHHRAMLFTQERPIVLGLCVRHETSMRQEWRAVNIILKKYLASRSNLWHTSSMDKPERPKILAVSHKVHQQLRQAAAKRSMKLRDLTEELLAKALRTSEKGK